MASAPATTNYQPVAQAAQTPSTARLLKVLGPEIARALPRGMDADRMARLVTTEVRKSRNAKAAGIAKHSLEECTQESFAGALLTASALGVEPGVQGECYLIPYRDSRRRVVECQLIIGYQGIIKLFWQHPRAARIDAQCVYSNDEFRYSKGLNPVLEHTAAQGDRGTPVYYYAIVEVTGAQPLWDVFTADEIKALRRGKVGSSGDIPDPQHWMERKTALKQVLKLAPKTTRLDAAIQADERGGTDLARSSAIELPGGVDTAPEYIEGEFTESGLEPDNTQVGAPAQADDNAAEVHYVSQDQLSKLAAIRKQERHDDDTSWFDYIASATGAKVTDDKKLTREQAQTVIDIFNEDAAK
ncbi:recombinase RecT [Mycolicibacterium vanbaalenii]|uniref:recombinase RecT n=1 Tax=Mycolicibacterium vanbaalenii TaxID=110539 RepID=UPI001F18BB24|nr:recombinase RecT [Mycolicibacterium vanbaalenii]UJL29965.1 recombinase RecT [Mycolicibacterium vanbaalenii]WND56974.1 recombinase RecT [Mycolicibacterium vanbaalenii]